MSAGDAPEQQTPSLPLCHFRLIVAAADRMLIIWLACAARIQVPAPGAVRRRHRDLQGAHGAEEAQVLAQRRGWAEGAFSSCSWSCASGSRLIGG